MVVMRIDNVIAFIAMPGQMYLYHPLQRQRIQVGLRVQPVVIAGHIHIIHIQQQMAVGRVGHGSDKLRLGNGGMLKLQVGRRVFQRYPASQTVLHLLYALHNMLE